MGKKRVVCVKLVVWKINELATLMGTYLGKDEGRRRKDEMDAEK